MALTRNFRTTVMARARADRRFRDALLSEAIEAFLAGEAATGRSMLRDLVNATLGFEELGRATGLPSKSSRTRYRSAGQAPEASSHHLFAPCGKRRAGLELARSRYAHQRARSTPGDWLSSAPTSVVSSPGEEPAPPAVTK
jgi:hypothetical protein